MTPLLTWWPAMLAGGLALRRRLNGMICFKAGFDDRVD
jgi:hypothetical protein